ncbi:MAG: glycine betaine/L-proline ABC transporter ATP-binding protein, partial [Dehalococcoidia bacterium]
MTVEKQQIEHQIEVNNLWKVFGRNPSSALASENSGKSRTEIQEEFGQVVALRDVSFNVQKGETFVVMGLSGSGKSTLVRCLIRLIEATSGNIFVEQEDVTSLDDSALQEFRRTKISMVFQNFGLLPHRNVMDNACYGLEVKGMSREERYERAQKMLDLVGLSGWEKSRVRQLSGGMQQRVGLARALAVEPEILLMDEPFSGLDPLIRRQMRSELADLQKELKKTMVFITHDLDEAVSVGDRIAIMRDGEIIQMGTPREIIMNPADEFVSEFTEDVSKDRVLNASS